MGIYLVILLMCLLLILMTMNNPDFKNKKLVLIILFLIITVISSIRSYSVGVDTVQYYYSFKYIISHSWSTVLSLRYEIGFDYFCKIISLLSKNPQIIIIMSSVIIFPSICNFIYKYSKNVSLSVFLYICLNIYFSHLNLMRQALACSIILLSLNFVIERKPLKFILTIIFATLFHSSAIIFLCIYPLYKIKYNKKSFYIYLIISVVGFLLCPFIIKVLINNLGKYQSYILNGKFVDSNYFGAVLKFLLYLFLYAISHFLYYQNDNFCDENKYKLFLIMSGLTMIFQCMSIKIEIINRLVPYFIVAFIIILPNVIADVKKSKKRFAMYMVIIFVCFNYWFIISLYRPNWTGCVPYLPYWNEKIIDWSGYFG